MKSLVVVIDNDCFAIEMNSHIKLSESLIHNSRIFIFKRPYRAAPLLTTRSSLGGMFKIVRQGRA